MVEPICLVDDNDGSVDNGTQGYNHTRDGENIFSDENDEHGLSQEAYYFIGGLMKHIKAITFITNPLVNSYKRLVPGYEAPTYIAWSANNRTPLIRIPESRRSGKRIELRSPDASANPYLALAVCLAAGMEGIREKILPPKEISQNIFELNEEEKKALGIECLPGSLMEAVEEFEKDAFIQKVLGEELSQKFIKAKKAEYDRYRSQVSEWEMNEYLQKY